MRREKGERERGRKRESGEERKRGREREKRWRNFRSWLPIKIVISNNNNAAAERLHVCLFFFHGSIFLVMCFCAATVSFIWTCANKHLK